MDPDPSIIKAQAKQALQQQRQQRASQRAMEAQMAAQQQQQQQQQQQLDQLGFAAAPQGTFLLSMPAGSMFTTSNVGPATAAWGGPPGMNTLSAPAAVSTDWNAMRMEGSNMPGAAGLSLNPGTSAAVRPASMAMSLANGSAPASGMVLNLQSSNSVSSQGPPGHSPFCISAPAGVNVLQHSGSMPRSSSTQGGGGSGEGGATAGAEGHGDVNQGGGNWQQAEQGVQQHGMAPHMQLPNSLKAEAQQQGAGLAEQGMESGHMQHGDSMQAQAGMSLEEMSVAQQLQQMAEALQQMPPAQPQPQQPSASQFMSSLTPGQMLSMMQQQQQQAAAHLDDGAGAHTQQALQLQLQLPQYQPQQVASYEFQAQHSNQDGTPQQLKQVQV